MATFRDAILPALDFIIAIPVGMGLRRYAVSVRIVTYSGTRVGEGTRTVTTTSLGQPHVRLVSSKDVAASGGLYTATDLRVGPIIPSYAGGGHSPSDLDPPEGANPTEVYYVVTGDGIPSGGVLYRRIGGEMASATQYFVILRSLGRPATPA